MEESKSNQGKKKITIKMGGGGFGAVVLMGGALATAALASAFVFRKNGRRSGKDHSGRHQNPPPEIKKQKEQDEADKAQQFVFLDQPSHVNNNPSSEAIKEVEQDNDDAFLVSNQSSALDEKSKPDNICDIESTEQILCPISPKELKTDVISNGYVVIEEKFPLMDEKLQFEPQNMMHGDEIAIHLTKEDVYNEIPKENQNPEQVHLVEERAESEHDQEDIKVILVKTEVEKGNDKETMFIVKCVAELAMANDQYLTDSTGWKIILMIATLFVMSSLSCSWFFGLSFVELCLVVFVTMVLSSWLLHSRHEIGKHM